MSTPAAKPLIEKNSLQLAHGQHRFLDYGSPLSLTQAEITQPRQTPSRGRPPMRRAASAALDEPLRSSVERPKLAMRSERA